jgi:uncharacterized Rossmann fold enzyme
MDFDEWEPKYKQILTDFGFERADDERSAEYLSKQLDENKDKLEAVTADDLKKLLENKSVFVFGEGPTLDDDVQAYKFEGTRIAADGATTELLKNDIVPDLIVTDLDGRVEDQVEAAAQGSIVLIHGHGDNLEALKKWVPEFEGKVIGTTQAKPGGNLFNYGGFTDGDRAVFLADHFSALLINLVAFDFMEVGDYKNEEAKKLKIRKLTWANLLIGVLENPDIEFIPPSVNP